MPRIGNLRQLVLVALVLSSACDSRGDAMPAPGGTADGQQATAGITWFHDLYEAHKRSAETGRPMLIVFGAKWCHYCREMDATTLKNPALVNYITTNFVPVHLDADHDKRVAEILKAKPIPCTVVLSPEADLLGKVIGYQEVKPYAGELEKTRQRYAQLLRKRAH